MTRLYQWLHEHANLIARKIFVDEWRRSVRVETTVQQERRSVLMTTAGLPASDVCPLCGGKIEIAQGTCISHGSGKAPVIKFPAIQATEIGVPLSSPALAPTSLSTPTPKDRT